MDISIGVLQYSGWITFVVKRSCQGIAKVLYSCILTYLKEKLPELAAPFVGTFHQSKCLTGPESRERRVILVFDLAP